MSSKPTTVDEFTPETLLMLGEGKVDIIWHREFYPVENCRNALPRIIDACEAAAYTLTSDLQSLGTSIGEATESEDNTARYFDTAAQTTKLIRESIFGGFTAPGDAVRLLADEWWPSGAMVGRRGDRQMLPSIIRRWPKGGQANPHIDQKSIPLLDLYDLVRRIGVNVYLETPRPGAGGEIEFWNRFGDENAYLFIKRDDYGVNRDGLGDPLYEILPGQGDLVMFDAARLHGVRKVTEGSRVTAACFLGVRSRMEPLVVFA